LAKGMLEKNIEVIKLGPYFASSQTVEEIEDIGMEARGIGPLQDEEYDNELINVTPPSLPPPRQPALPLTVTRSKGVDHVQDDGN